jgi:hypothetical protein
MLQPVQIFPGYVSGIDPTALTYRTGFDQSVFSLSADCNHMGFSYGSRHTKEETAASANQY